jgi:hypothetical protein
MGEDHYLFAKSPHSREGRSTVALVRESLMLEARGSSTRLSIEN